ncbi:MAG: hypothetical protein K0V04_17720 [Deltaproteobacteria bacterium]|nr:hypothetical protein [Deltaproteobacteria bacterium]
MGVTIVGSSFVVLMAVVSGSSAPVVPTAEQVTPAPERVTPASERLTPESEEVASEPPPRRARPLDFELSGIAVTPTLTGPTVGPDVGVAIGRERLHARVGMQVVGGPDQRVSRDGHRVGEIVETGTLHVCAARGLRGFRVRICGGGQLGVTHLRYVGFAQRGRRVVPWGAVTSFGDLAIPLGRRTVQGANRVGLLLQGGAMLPVLGPELVVDGGPEGGRRTRRPRSFGATFGAGIRVSLR